MLTHASRSSRHSQQHTCTHSPSPQQARNNTRSRDDKHALVCSNLDPYPVPIRKKLCRALLLCGVRGYHSLPAENIAAAVALICWIKPLRTGNWGREIGAGAEVSGDNVGGEGEGCLSGGANDGAAGYG